MVKVENLTVGTRTENGEVTEVRQVGKLYFVGIRGHLAPIAYGIGQFVR
jgi:hypothetical protein